MSGKNTFRKRFENFAAGKGFYIVLILCVAVIGVSSWVLMRAGTDANMPPVQVTGGTNTDGSLAQKPDITPDMPTSRPTEDMAETISTPKVTPPPQTTQPVQTPTPTAPATPSSKPDKLTFYWPVAGETGMPYSIDELIYSKTMGDWRTHDGIDILAPMGTRVVAAASGTVERVYNDVLMGTTIVIDHGDGLKSIYSNLAGTPNVAEGDSVSGGDIIASVGDSAIAEISEAAHLHFSMSKDGKSADPADYLPVR